MTYSPDDYDAKGQLRLPLSFWAILLLLGRTWVLFIAAGASRQQGDSLLALFYPDNHAFWLGLASGLPAVPGLLLTGYRQRLPRLWQAWRWVLVLSLMLTLGMQSASLWQDEEQASSLVLMASLLDILALAALLFYRRLRDCFDPAENH
ncbi:DUF2919 domain-containing protein [Erwinia sp. Eh17-17]|uniref:DUF2919 domain-containing protein n=1 Tax=Erwinia sp. Eh17-17 TaxID=3080330 RepID=UPI003208D2EF